ncbi:MAG TPA: hypothetical protein VFU30_10905 [Gaiellaceae bacterium]|nr:hypothetical protein [Gaiellaceae bacterium]
MRTPANGNARAARAELRAWYLRGLLPKLARAASSGVIELREVEGLDAEVRALLDLSPREEAA